MDAQNYVLWLLGRRQYTEKQLREKLNGKGYNQDEIGDVIAKCKKYKYIDDLNYAKSFIRNRDMFNPRGKRILRLELIKRGIAGEDINQALENDEEISDRDELKLVRELAQKKYLQYAKLDRAVAYRRLYGQLARRGFDLYIIKEVLDENFNKK